MTGPRSNMPRTYPPTPVVTTARRDLLRPHNGMGIYNSSFAKAQHYENGQWVNDTVRLSAYGDGSDGAVTISADTSLSRDMYYSSLTVNATKVLTTAGYRIFVSGILTNNGTIRNNGNAASGGSNGAALAAGSLGGGAAGGAATVGTGWGGAGGGGAGVLFIAAREIINTSGVISANGGNGGNAQAGGESGNGSNGSSQASLSLGGAGGNGGASGGASSAGNGGTVTAPTAANGGFKSAPQAALLLEIVTGNPIVGGAGGGGGAYDTADAGGGGGGGGGVVVLLYDNLTSGTETANGGTGGAKVGGGSVGVDGSAGTVIKLAA